MPSLSVFGAQWGDEGKGKLIDFLAEGKDVVVRYQGGANAGHTVVVEGDKYVLHLIPSGILHPGMVNMIGPGVAVDPIKLLEEVDGLLARGVHVDGDNLRLAAGAHVIFEHHKRIDGLAEIWRGKGRIGTTGRGIGPCYGDKAARTGLRVADLLDPERAKDRLGAALAEKNALIERVHGEEPLNVPEQIEHYVSMGDRLRPFVADVGAEVRRAYKEGREVLFEGAQGVMLDIDHGTYPYVTSSSTGVGGIAGGAAFPPQHIDQAWGIAKAYCTRVGEGPFPSEIFGEEAEALRKAGNEFGATTGRPRRAGWFDAVAVRYAFDLTGASGWIMTKLDVLSGLQEIPYAVTYKTDSERWTEYPAHLASMEDVRVEMESMPGWSEDITGVRSFDDLPANARAYVEHMETITGVPIVMISVGPGREAVIQRSN
ncbi:MAG TPA: adenylosuccinate synthase [Planctomycetes bacterium]|nr:adenylosuccinate synthase [Planctomycetota bacterium]HIK60325.1 adenylosuccinate synthase [Planctomycetota bacterium]